MRGPSVEEAAMPLAAHRLPRPPSPEYRALPWHIKRYRLLADAMMARGDGESAGAYEETALLREHQAALDLARTQSPAPLCDAGAHTEAIMHRLLRGGATDIAFTTHPLWIIGHGPS